MENYLLIDFNSKSLKKQMKWMNGLIRNVERQILNMFVRMQNRRQKRKYKAKKKI